MSPVRLLFTLLVLSLASRPADARQDTPLVVMNLAAHPDDEDGSTLAYYRYGKDAVAYSVIYTRGEGGQNEIGPELYESLGALRTDETERAARILGTQVFFLNFKDFGYSKHGAEAFEKWGGRDLVTERIVYLIRKLKPDLLFTNHDTVTTGPRRQHGQHQAVGVSAYDAFALAADPAYHPEQLEEDGVDLWQPKRLFLRRWRGAEEGYDVAVPIGDLHEASGRTYGEIAGEALHEHASQGMGMFAGRFRREANYFVLYRSATDAPLDTADLAGHLPPNRTAAPDLSYRIASGRVPALAPGGLRLEDSTVVAGQAVRLHWDTDRLPTQRLRWVFSGAVDTTLYLTPGEPSTALLRVEPDAAPAVPKDVYQYDRFLSHPPVTFALYRAGSDEILAAGHLPLEVAPAVHVAPEEEVTRLHAGTNEVPVEITVYDPRVRDVTLSAAVSRDDARSVVYQVQHRLTVAEGAHRHTVRLVLPDRLSAGDYTVTLTALPAAATLAPAPAHAYQAARVFDVEVPAGLRVGVVESYDNTLAHALGQLGVEHVLLDSLALAQGRFDGLHTIIVDIRAYLVRPDLRRYNSNLLEWVRRGGHLVVNYQKTFEWNAEYDDPFVAGVKNPGTFSPYPIHLGRDRVTREDAPVEILVPDHALFTRPNAIAPADWDGWVQERGLYFPDAHDARYTALFRMSDPGEAPLASSTLLAQYGQGSYLYTALVWYRQLKAYHPGGYKLFANMISLPLLDDRAAATH